MACTASSGCSGQCIILLERADMVLQGTEGKLGTIDVAMYGPHEPGGPHSCRHENGFLKGRTVSTENSVQLFHQM